MKFPRNARIFRGQLDAAPFATVFFLLVIFLMLASLVYTPGGVPLRLPVANDLPGLDERTVAVAVDAGGRLFFENQPVQASQLRDRLKQAAKASHEPLTLVVEADRTVTMDMTMRLTMLAREAGITNLLLAALSKPMAGTP
jgi:biopolymer transport protein ExbD